MATRGAGYPGVRMHVHHQAGVVVWQQSRPDLVLHGVGVISVVATVPQPSTIDLSGLRGFRQGATYEIRSIRLAWGGGGQVSESTSEAQTSSTPYGPTGMAVGAPGVPGALPYTAGGTLTRTRDANRWARFEIHALDGTSGGWEGEYLLSPEVPRQDVCTPLEPGWRGQLQLVPDATWLVVEGAGDLRWSVAVARLASGEPPC